MPKYEIEAGQVLEVIESDLLTADEVKQAIESEMLVNGSRISAYYHKYTAPVIAVRALSGQEEAHDAGQTDAAALESGAGAPVLREGSAGSEVGAGEGLEDSSHGEGLDPQAGAQSAQPA